MLPMVSLPMVSSAQDGGAAKAALSAANRQDWAGVATVLPRLKDPLLSEILTAERLTDADSGASFEERVSFLRAHPDWPQARALRLRIEETMPRNLAPADITAWFRALPPLTNEGNARAIAALIDLGQKTEAARQARDFWRRASLGEVEQRDFLKSFGGLLSRKDHEARLDRLLWNDQRAAAARMYPLVSREWRELAAVRLALSGQKRNVSSMLLSVPAALRDQPGLLYERLRWRRMKDQDAAAIEILDRAPAELGDEDAWFQERSILVRRMMEKQDWATAYRLAAAHGLKAGDPKTAADWAQGEFLAGWLALRFLHKPDVAEKHFAALARGVTTPVSRSRAAYWLARAADAAGNAPLRDQRYAEAARFSQSFYGQLAADAIGQGNRINVPQAPMVAKETRLSFYAHPLVKAAQLLTALGEPARAESYFNAALKLGQTEVDFFLIAELADRMGRSDLAVKAAKEAQSRGLIPPPMGWPILEAQWPAGVDPALLHALIRQESSFRTDAVSPAGARGLMQLMPKTAKAVARQEKVPHSDQRLFDPSHNVRLGAAYIQARLQQFDGSLILALAAYNAGQGRARQWIAQNGDPRSDGVDAIDWIERIPVSETRNYVQRVLENLRLYQAVLRDRKGADTDL